MLYFTLSVIIHLMQLAVITTHEVRELEVCDREQFSVTCPSGSVILITSATYGRMREGRCVKQQPLGCQVDVLDDMDRRCSGRQSCSFLVMLLYVPDVCPDEMMGYVQATYTCVNVMTCDSCEPETHLHAPSTSGIISGLSPTSNCGSSQCPWLIRAQPGQKFNFTLYQFSQHEQNADAAAAVRNKRYKPRLTISSHYCHHITTIRSLGTNRGESGDVIREMRICDETPRSTNFVIEGYTDIEVVLMATAHAQTEPRFLIEYEVIGCGDIEIPKDSTSSRKEDELIIRCKNGASTWSLRCGPDNEWIGKYGSCQKDASNPGNGNRIKGNPNGRLENPETPKSVWVLVICAGLLIGILFGAGLLVAVAYCFKGSSSCFTYRHDGDSGAYRDQNHDGHMTPDFHRCEKHGQFYTPAESAYQCTHTLQRQLPPQCTLTRPDLCMQGFRPVPEGDAASLDDVVNEGNTDSEVANNVMNKLKIYEQQRAATLRDNARTNTNPVCSSFKPSRDNISAL